MSARRSNAPTRSRNTTPDKDKFQAQKEINWSPKSVPTFGHTFKLHGAGKKRTTGLTGRAATEGKEQGQWLDENATAQISKQRWDPGNPETRIIDIPPGVGQVIKPGGSIVPVTRALIVPNRATKIYRSGYPISENFDGDMDAI
ncbi:hypothetical protein HUT16_18925 [Kitasatospora sp. NA04385]|uniref:hypothetical protein n=1 Tax=Kitasatospora sp. NA04385 TaxID=2742135 RepID=UPI001590D831|nr:hypothetical protein [Kitasatospora sp. NA04385]QKW20858.1 hypothetical protein HUT16_18925 [Kitasatospora sp. NA04385]